MRPFTIDRPKSIAPLPRMTDKAMVTMQSTVALLLLCASFYLTGCAATVKVEDARRFEIGWVACVTESTCKGLGVLRPDEPVSVAVDPETQ